MAPAHTEVFILDIVRDDGSRFITSVGTAGSVREAGLRHKAIKGSVSHWKRDGESQSFSYAADRRARDWRLNERFAL